MTTTTRTCPSCDSPDGTKWHRLSCVEVRSAVPSEPLRQLALDVVDYCNDPKLVRQAEAALR